MEERPTQVLFGRGNITQEDVEGKAKEDENAA
jgi:hypothetical protein